MNLGFVAKWFRDHWLLLWFLVLSIGWLDPQFLGIDGRIYGAAARAWANGADPWMAGADGYLFAAPPPSILATAPVLLLPQQLDGLYGIVVALVAALVALRALRLAAWWLLFPPLAEGIWAGNLDAAALALLLTRLSGAAVLAKIYAAVPLIVLGRWRAVAASFIVLIGTAPLLPWATYLARFPEIAATLAEQSVNPHSAYGTVLLIPTAVALLLVGRRSAAWLAVPALWPSTQPHYATLVLPVARGKAAALLALPLPLVVPIATIAWALWRVGSAWAQAPDASSAMPTANAIPEDAPATTDPPEASS